jgi:molybdopterin synthase catalytic subunit
MQTLGVVGDDAPDLLERLVPQLDGRVATVEPLPESRETSETTASATYTLGPDGRWRGSGDDRSLSELLDSLAPTFDVAVVVDFPEATVPTVALGDAEARNVAFRVPDPSTVDVQQLLDLVDEGEPHVTLETLVERAKRSPRADRAGAIATFTGRVRAKDSEDDARTTHLEFEKYERVAERRMDTIASELEARDGVFDVLLHHRTGVVADGEDIVFVVVLAGHREEAFRTVEDGINRLKDEVPLFKKEVTVDDQFWVHTQE